MAPRMREAYVTSPFSTAHGIPAPSRSPLPAKRSLLSPRPRRKPHRPVPQKTPFELFAAQYEVPGDADKDSRVQEYSIDIQAEWDRLSPDERQVWEAQYGRQVLESTSNQQTPVEVISNDRDHDVSGHWSADSEVDSPRVPLREKKPPRKAAKHRGKKRGDNPDQDSGSDSPAAPKPTAKVLYRTELYRVKKDGDGNLMSDYTKTTKHDKPPKLILNSAPMHYEAPDPVDETLPIFEVTTFLAAPAWRWKDFDAMNQENPFQPGYPQYAPPLFDYGGPPPRPPTITRPARRTRFRTDSITPSEDDFEDDASELDPDKPIEIEGEAGTILEIHSPLLIDAIQKVGPGYPGLAMEGSSLTVTEPFCAFMHYREQVKGYYEVSEEASADKSLSNGTAPASKSAEKSEELKAPNGLPATTRTEGAAHVDELYDFLDNLYLKAVVSERERWTRETAMCTFEWAWLLFPPQTLIYEPKSADSPVSRAFRVKGFRLQGLFEEARRSHTPSVNPHRLKSRQDPHFKNHLEKIIIVASYLKHDGRKWMSQTKEFKIFPFKGEKKVVDLPVYPAKFFNDKDSATRKHLIERGKRYHSLASRGQYEYHGETLSGARRRLDGRIMVDSETYHYDRGLTQSTKDRDTSPSRRSREIEVIEDRNSDSDRGTFYSNSDSGSESDDGPFNITKEAAGRGRRRVIRRSRRARPQIKAKLDAAEKEDEEAEELFMICHSELRAWVLKERDWVRLSVDSISPCTFDERMIDDLQITAGAKRLIQAFSQSYSMPLGSPVEQTTGAWSADFVPGKGRGQIMLLHGRPGVGKTTCAECIAELTKRPLLTITCGDLGTNSYLVEQELTRWLRLGALWNAVLLFDEADVFLESREHGDIERNSLVSVFLRALEYYQGLMFLTTNRIGTFDEAILSRVHVILHFPDLTDTERAKIWDTSFRKLADERPNIKIDFSLYDLAYRDENIKKLKWNGREIRNAFNTMIALAEFDAHQNQRYSKEGKVEVRREHLQEVAGMSGDFKRYMVSLRGLDSAGYAKGQGLRDDEFEGGDGKSKGREG